MRAAQYHFVSEYALRGQRQAVWDALTDVEGAPRWWKGLERVEIVRPPTGTDGIGAIYRSHVRAPSGYGFEYSTEITDVYPLRRIDLLSSGELVGRGRFLLSQDSTGVLHLAFAWLVETPKRWMTLLAPVARPVFTWNHDQLMTRYGHGLAHASRAILISSHNTTLKPGSPGFHVLPEV
jgi:Polyketide cyclase / dehydrase and lipid transport